MVKPQLNKYEQDMRLTFVSRTWDWLLSIDWYLLHFILASKLLSFISSNSNNSVAFLCVQCYMLLSMYLNRKCCFIRKTLVKCHWTCSYFLFVKTLIILIILIDYTYYVMSSIIHIRTHSYESISTYELPDWD